MQSAVLFVKQNLIAHCVVSRSQLPGKRKVDAYDAEYDRGKQKKVRGQGRQQDAWQELGSGGGSNMFESAWQSRSGGGAGRGQPPRSPGSGGGRRGGGRGGGGWRGRGRGSPGRGRRGGGFRGRGGR